MRRTRAQVEELRLLMPEATVLEFTGSTEWATLVTFRSQPEWAFQPWISSVLGTHKKWLPLLPCS